MSVYDVLEGVLSESVPKISPIGQIARLRESMARFITDQVPFKVGDLVVARADSPVVSKGDPALVIAVLHGEGFTFECGSGPGSSCYGTRVNLRILSLRDDAIVPFWADAAFYELYTGEDA